MARFSDLAHLGLVRAAENAAACRPCAAAVSGSGPAGADTILDRVTSAVTGSSVDPASLMGYPHAVPSDWAGRPNGIVEYAFYTEGVNAGAVRGGLALGLVGLVLGALAAFSIQRSARSARGKKT